MFIIELVKFKFVLSFFLITVLPCSACPFHNEFNIGLRKHKIFYIENGPHHITSVKHPGYLA